MENILHSSRIVKSIRKLQISKKMIYPVVIKPHTVPNWRPGWNYRFSCPPSRNLWLVRPTAPSVDPFGMEPFHLGIPNSPIDLIHAYIILNHCLVRLVP